MLKGIKIEAEEVSNDLENDNGFKNRAQIWQIDF